MASKRFEHRTFDLLASLGEVTSRPLLGGLGLYWRETIFGISSGRKLYLKIDERSKADFDSRGMGPFRPNGHQTFKPYYEVPDNPEALLSWAYRAIRAGQESQVLVP